MLAGDACGVRIAPSSFVLPVSPPPDIDVEAWHATTAEIRRREPERLALVHFGVHTDPGTHLDRLDAELDRWAARVHDGMDADEFVDAARADAGEEADRYDTVAPFVQSWFGLKRYWDKREEAENYSVRRMVPPDVCASAIKRISSMFTCGGRVSANMTQSATSSAESGPPIATVE